VPVEAREEVVRYVEKTAHSIVGNKAFPPFSVSARDGLSAKQMGDTGKLQESGLLDFQTALVQFLANNRAQLFLSSMGDRTLIELRSLPEAEAETLISKLHILRQQVDPQLSSGPKQPNETDVTRPTAAGVASRSTGTCEVCKAVMGKTMRFLARYQYDLSTRPEIQEQHAKDGGFCPLHTWHYEQIASPRGVSTAYPALLNRAAGHLRSLADNMGSRRGFASPLLECDCPACKVRWATEDQTIASILGRVGQVGDSDKLTLSSLCLPHLQLILRRTENESFRKWLLHREAALMERIAEDMQRYAIKYDALRRDLASAEEQDSYLQALQLLVGHRNVNAVFSVRDIM
jgi:hypothetical protein